MNPNTKKYYHIHGIDARHHLDSYFSEDMVFAEDFFKFPMMNLHYVFSRVEKLASEKQRSETHQRCKINPNTKKYYHIHGIDARHHLDSYFSEDMVFAEDFFKFPMMNLHYVFSRGFIHGSLLIDLSKGSFIHHLYSACNNFKDIIIMKFTEKCALEMLRWLDGRTGAFSWNHTKAALEELEGKCDQFQDKELKLKKSIKQILSCNHNEENLAQPLVLPLADCIISIGLLDVISLDQEDYMRNLKKISKQLKIGGHLILMGLLNTTYVMEGTDWIHWFRYDERFVKSSLSKEGFVIDYWAVQRRRNVSDLIDYSHAFFITAHKEK